MARVMDVALRVAELPWVWGRNDCCTFACDVFAEVYGIDPMADIRGTYDSAITAARLVVQRGGMDTNVRKTLRDAGLVPCSPREGALGVVTDTGGRKAAAICAGSGLWLARTTNGMSSRATASEVHHVAL